MVQLALMEIGSCFHRQPQTLDVMLFAGRNIRQSQQKIRRNFKVIRDGDKIFTGQFACFSAITRLKVLLSIPTACSQLNLRDVSASAQVAGFCPLYFREAIFPASIHPPEFFL